MWCNAGVAIPELESDWFMDVCIVSWDLLVGLSQSETVFWYNMVVFL